jgi:hypothetical protein
MTVVARITILLSSLALAACSSSPTAPSSRLPANVRLQASASGTAGQLSITCQLDFTGTLEDAGGSYRGTLGGEAVRTVLLPDGSGMAFSADAFYPEIRIAFARSGRARLQAFLNGSPWAPEGISRFWDALLTFDGTYDAGAQSISGTWTCRPLDTRGDDLGDVTGTWTLRGR